MTPRTPHQTSAPSAKVAPGFFHPARISACILLFLTALLPSGQSVPNEPASPVVFAEVDELCKLVPSCMPIVDCEEPGCVPNPCDSRLLECDIGEDPCEGRSFAQCACALLPGQVETAGAEPGECIPEAPCNSKESPDKPSCQQYACEQIAKLGADDCGLDDLPCNGTGCVDYVCTLTAQECDTGGVVPCNPGTDSEDDRESCIDYVGLDTECTDEQWGTRDEKFSCELGCTSTYDVTGVVAVDQQVDTILLNVHCGTGEETDLCNDCDYLEVTVNAGTGGEGACEGFVHDDSFTNPYWVDLYCYSSPPCEPHQGCEPAGAMATGMDTTSCPEVVPTGLSLIAMRLGILDAGSSSSAQGIFIKDGQCLTFEPTTQNADGGWFIRS